MEEVNGVKVDLQLRESQAIVRYIDRLVPVPSLHLSEDDAVLEEKMWEFVSIVASYGTCTICSPRMRWRILTFCGTMGRVQ